MIILHKGSKLLSTANLPMGFLSGCYSNTIPERGRKTQYLFSLLLYATAWSILRNNPLSNREQTRLTLLSVAAPLFDDLFDIYHVNQDIVRSIIANPESDAPICGNALLECFRSLVLVLFKNLGSSQNTVSDICLKLIRAQEISKNLNEQSSMTEIEQATREKGGYAALLIRYMLDNPAEKEEYDVAYASGLLAQLMDDVFDMSADKAAERITSAYLFRNAGEAREYFLQKEKYWLALCYAMPYPVTRIQRFARFMHFLYSPVQVCLRQYEHYEKRHGKNYFDPLAKTFPAFVCDMEKWSNRFRLLVQVSRTEKIVFS